MKAEQPAAAAPVPLATVLALLRVDAPGGVYGRPEDWPRWSALLPHVLAATKHADATELAESATVCSWLLDRAGMYLHTQGRYADAAPLMRRAVAIGEQALGPDHVEVATGLNNLGMVVRELGEPADARLLAERALAITERALDGMRHRRLAREDGRGLPTYGRR